MRAIFISYRRDDAEGQAGRLFNDLTQHFGEDAVFMDVAGIEPGRDFRRVIDNQVSSCGVLLAIIGKGWLTAKDESGARRLDDPMDFVRLETASALKRDIPVVPVLVHAARMPRVDDLPEDLKDLAFRNGVELTHARWDSDVQVLVKALQPYVQAKQDQDKPPLPSAPSKQGRTRTGSVRIVIAVLASVLVFGGYVWHQKSSEEAAREAATLEESKRLVAAEKEKAKVETDRVAKEKGAAGQAGIAEETPEAKKKAGNVLSFRDWQGFWNLQWEYHGKWYEKIMNLRSDQSGIAGEYELGTLKGTFVRGDASKVAGEYTNTAGSGVDCSSGKQGGQFTLTLASGGRSMDGWWDVCGDQGTRRKWKADRRGITAAETAGPNTPPQK
jgi:hypothetical protein